MIDLHQLACETHRAAVELWDRHAIATIEAALRKAYDAGRQEQSYFPAWPQPPVRDSFCHIPIWKP